MNFPIISLTVDRGLYAYAVDSSEQLWQTSLQTATDPRSWVQIEAVTPSVTIAGSTLYGVTVDRNIASRSSPVTDPTNPAPWQSFLVTPFHNITHVAGNDAGELWFLDSGLGVYRANRLTGTATRDSGVVASQIVVGNDAVYAVSSDKGLCARQFDVPGWACQPIPATQVAVSATHVFIVDQAHYLYESPLPFNETLPFVRTAMTQIGAFTADVSSGALWADDGQGGIFRFCDGSCLPKTSTTAMLPSSATPPVVGMSAAAANLPTTAPPPLSTIAAGSANIAPTDTPSPLNAGLVVGLTLTALFLIVSVIVALFWCRRRRRAASVDSNTKPTPSARPPPSPPLMRSAPPQPLPLPPSFARLDVPGLERASVDSGSRAGPGVGRAKKFEVGSLFAGIKRASQYSEAPPMYDSSTRPPTEVFMKSS